MAVNSKIKICGVRTVETAEAAARLGADALGINFVPKSKRFIKSIKTAAKLTSGLRAISGCPLPLLSGVFVNTKIEDVAQAVKRCELDIVQLHGDETPEYIQELRRFISPMVDVWKAFPIANADDVETVNRYTQKIRLNAVLLDAKSAMGEKGGTGKTFDWSLLKEFVRVVPIALAGGLTAVNVADAVQQVHPDWVDTAGGVESEPGVKDVQKIKEFIGAVRK